ncbi:MULTISPECIES: acyl-CoA dehydrogenase family protein [Actinoalloteichus]|uniref:acyl-CoA dehydrogenase family protein n=1 Tax=Actinoalloteichus TaxID=65496 RepID=UPI0026897639
MIEHGAPSGSRPRDRRQESTQPDLPVGLVGEDRPDHWGGVIPPDDAPATSAEALSRARALSPLFAARAAQHDEAGAFPITDFQQLRSAGLFGLMAPRRLGGTGASFGDYVEIAIELACGSGATALVFNMHSSVVGALTSLPATLVDDPDRRAEVAQAHDRILAAALTGKLFAVALSERRVGSRLSRMSTTYHEVEQGYRIIGEKSFVSAAGHADLYLVGARSAVDRDYSTPTVSYFVVPAGSGVEVVRSWDTLGMRATASDDLRLDVTVGRDALLGGVEGLAPTFVQAMPHWMIASYAAVYVGVAESALREARSQLSERGLDHLPAVRGRMGRADAAVAAARLAVREAANRVDRDPGSPATNRWVWRAKLLAGDTAATVASSVLEAAGTAATTRGNPLERIYRDARYGALHPATSDVCADWLGIAALGGDPERDTAVPRW